MAGTEGMIYLDHAATSWPKPPEVTRAMVDFLERAGGNPGRSGHRLSIEAGKIVNRSRELITRLFNAPDPMRVIFTLNATHAINLALGGLLVPGDHVVTSGIEHNAVMRPLHALVRQGIQITTVPCDANGALTLDDLEQAVQPGTRLVVLNHASNVVGTILPIEAAAKIAHRAGALLLVDGAQTAGVVDIDLQASHIDLLAFAGHKGLQGPPGTGGLVINTSVDLRQLRPLLRGGTGSRSESEEQPTDMPDRYESGTINGVGIAGLGAGIQWILERGVSTIREHEMSLTNLLLDGLATIPGITVYGPPDPQRRTAVISFTSAEKQGSEIGQRLDQEYGVLVRVGLHCAPAAHKTLGTFPKGTVRLAPGVLTSADEIHYAVKAVAEVVKT